ncbi:LacI family DNA-binding transcriptional regulator [Streptomyces muensis]|uniref:LacI family DNA-binding transcriptional regulator n=1 Tax=Streptomyces muensis TaxID=1077944 RepID=A0A9X1PZC4_STRM4|nr:LacI family DNA-binding transcriptional regulator [Streptomyces muensis]MCF1595205.1 LacI family DNA-binding transcriptional regulator [Streptomyces muensis]
MAQRRVTLADVARHAGLSTTAASWVLNEREDARLSEDARRRVLAAAQELGYRPNAAARSLRIRKTATIALISDTVATTRFAGGMIRGALSVARDREHVLLIAETQGDPELERHAIDAMLHRQVDGVVYAAMYSRRLTVPQRLLDTRTVLLNATSAHGLPAVLPAEEDAGYAVAAALLGQGHRRIAVLGRIESIERSPRRSLAAGLRMRGIRRALADRGLRLAVSEHTRDWEARDGHAGMTSLLERGSIPSAVICMNDRLAFGAYQAAADAGKAIPDDISIVSFDDDPIAEWLRPGLTTAALPHEEMGRLAVELLLDETAEPGTRWVPMPLRERGSIGQPAT